MSTFCRMSGRKRIFLSIAAISLLLPLYPFDTGAKVTYRGRVKKIIVIDPGHGGHDTGVRSSGGAPEKTIALSLARLVASELKGKYSAVLTRTDDYGLDVPGRADAANYAKADAFISIHTGGSFLREAGGMTIYYYKETSASHLPPADDRAKKAVLDEDRTPWDRLQQEHIGASRLLAQTLKKRIGKQITFMDCKIAAAPLLLLRGADMPAVLFETGHLTNLDDEKHLRNEQDLRKIARAVAAGIEDFIDRDRR